MQSECSENTYTAHEHEALSVGDDLRSIQGLLQVIDKGLLITIELGRGAGQKAGSAHTLRLDGAEAAGKDSLTNEGDRKAQVERVDGSPLACALLASLVEDLLDKRLPVIIIELENVASNLDQEGVQDALVPLVKDVANLRGRKAKTALQEIICLESSS